MFVTRILFSCSYCVVWQPSEFYGGALYNGHVGIHSVLALHFTNRRLQWAVIVYVFLLFTIHRRTAAS